MSENNSSARSGGVGFWGLLTVALIVLKLTGHIDLSWGWIVVIFFAPLWIILGFAGLFFVLGIVIFIIALIWEWIKPDSKAVEKSMNAYYSFSDGFRKGRS